MPPRRLFNIREALFLASRNLYLCLDVETVERNHRRQRTMKDSSRAVPVDILRILAASMIFYHHGGLATGWALAPWGEDAVAAFIYLTGYCTIKYSRPITGSLWKYWLGKFKAIYPTFFILALAIF